MQKIRFLIVGLWNTLIGYSIYYFFYSLMEGVFDEEYQAYMTSMIISQFLSIVNSYLSHKYITFKSKIKGMGMVSEFFKFTSAYIGTFIITILMLPLVTELFTLDPRLSAIIVMAIVAVGSYLLNAKYIFK